jgi:predicted ATPase
VARSPHRRPAWLTAYGHQIGEVRAALDWAFSPTGAAEIGAALTVAAVPLWVHLLLMEECRGRVEQPLSGPAESETHVAICNYTRRLARRS